MENNYIAPQIEVIEIEIEDAVLANSGGIEDTKPGVSFGIDNRSRW